ncbi:hypothetical protein FA13DRAFT_1899235 [Coprinellus micaceus]|uniref:Uncharacterized protein n=1 Tax=Coprinellus micaceus TaxID=71717 RepID=A0A4Y7SUH5_COPMI|nr:hypothetical protein FA13DRAFT_1899235 [Coprinellus micaceus]
MTYSWWWETCGGQQVCQFPFLQYDSSAWMNIETRTGRSIEYQTIDTSAGCVGIAFSRLLLTPRPVRMIDLIGTGAPGKEREIRLGLHESPYCPQLRLPPEGAQERWAQWIGPGSGPCQRPDLFFDPATKATVRKGEQANMFPFGEAAGGIGGTTPLSNPLAGSCRIRAFKLTVRNSVAMMAALQPEQKLGLRNRGARLNGAGKWKEPHPGGGRRHGAFDTWVGEGSLAAQFIRAFMRKRGDNRSTHL